MKTAKTLGFAGSVPEWGLGRRSESGIQFPFARSHAGAMFEEM